MKHKTLWAIAFSLFIAHFFLQYVVIKRYDLSDIIGIINLVTDLLANIIILILFSGIISSLLAFIPFQQKNYPERITYILPITISVILSILLVAFVYVYLFLAI